MLTQEAAHIFLVKKLLLSLKIMIYYSLILIGNDYQLAAGRCRKGYNKGFICNKQRSTNR